MEEITVTIQISTQDYLAHYQGLAKEVVTKAEDGRTIRFPSSILQPFVSHHGINGRFVISFDKDNRFSGIRATT